MTYLALTELGRSVRAARKAAGLRQVDVAVAASVSRYTLIKLERGQLADINYKTLASILAAMGLELRLTEARPSGLPILGEAP